MLCECKGCCVNDCIGMINDLKGTDMVSCKDCNNTEEIKSHDEAEYDSKDDRLYYIIVSLSFEVKSLILLNVIII